MPFRLTFIFLAAALAVSAAAKKTGTATGENDELIVTATLYTDPADIKDLVGSDLDSHYFIAEVKIQPKYGKTVTVDRDDFLLRCFDGNDTAKPFVASQIAGPSTMTVGKVTEGEGKKARPRVAIGGMGGITGNMESYDNAAPKVKDGGSAQKSELEKTLDAKILPDGKTDKPVSGLLYFAMEKHKLKDMALSYGSKENRITLRFK